MPSRRSPTMIAIAVSFRDTLRASGCHRTAFGAAVATYRARHPEATDLDVQEAVALMIAEAGEEFGPWLFGRERKPKPRTLRL